MVNYTIDKRNKVVKLLYYNEQFGTCLEVHTYSNNVELDNLKKELNLN